MNRKSNDAIAALIALLVACIIAASDSRGGGLSAQLGAYFYWICRIAIEAVLFISIRIVLERVSGRLGMDPVLILGAALISHVPFVLSVTAFDLVLGFPELGIGSDIDSQTQRLTAFSFELVYLLDNHLFLCLLMSLPRWMSGDKLRPQSASSHAPSTPTTLLSGLTPPLAGKILWAEAQEHYVRIVTTEESRLVLCRFSDLIRELPERDGFQVHRSHWVAFRSIEERLQEGQTTKLLLATGDKVPVSRSYRKRVSERLI